MSEEVLIPRGHPRNPMTDEEVENKFRDLTRGRLPQKAGKRLLDTLWGLEKVKDVAGLVRLMRTD